MYRFIPDVALDSCEFLNFRLAVLSQPCPHCQCSGNLKAHGFVKTKAQRNLSSRNSDIRALRFCCSDRRSKNGCGRTFSIHFEHCIPGSTLQAQTVSSLIESFSSESRPQDNNNSCSRSTRYRWRKRFRLYQWQLRSLSALLRPPEKDPQNSSAEEMTLKELKLALPNASCLTSAFQTAVQRDFCSLGTGKNPLCHQVVSAFKNLFRVATPNDTLASHQKTTWHQKLQQHHMVADEFW